MHPVQSVSQTKCIHVAPCVTCHEQIRVALLHYCCLTSIYLYWLLGCCQRGQFLGFWLVLRAVFRKTHFKKPSPLGFGGFCWVLGFIGFSDFFCLNEAVGKLVGWFSSSAELLLRFARILDYLNMCKFIAYWSLEAVNIKKSLVITGMTNWNWIECGAGFFAGFYPLESALRFRTSEGGELWVQPTNPSLPGKWPLNCVWAFVSVCWWFNPLPHGDASWHAIFKRKN